MHHPEAFMKRTRHILVATTRPYTQVAEALGRGLQIHLAPDADECLVLAASLRPTLALVDLSRPEFAQPDFLRVLANTLGEETPVVGWAEPSRKGKVKGLLNSGLLDIWSWSDPPALHANRIALLEELQELRRASRRWRQERRAARKALVHFLRRLEDAFSYPLDNLDAYLNILYRELRRHAEGLLPQLDRMAGQHREIREVLIRLHQLARSLDQKGLHRRPLPKSLEEVSAVMDPPSSVRTDPKKTA
jgi:hypothetical protein